jgi:anti-anti-sigma factor
LKVKISIIEDVLAIIKIDGEFSIFDDEFDLFAKEIAAYTKMGIYRFIIDLSNVTYVDSSGIGIIIRLATGAMKKDTRACVICDQPNVLKVFQVSNVDKIIKFIDSVEDGFKFFEKTTDFHRKVDL